MTCLTAQLSNSLAEPSLRTMLFQREGTIGIRTNTRELSMTQRPQPDARTSRRLSRLRSKSRCGFGGTSCLRIDMAIPGDEASVRSVIWIRFELPHSLADIQS